MHPVIRQSPVKRAGASTEKRTRVRFFREEKTAANAMAADLAHRDYYRSFTGPAGGDARSLLPGQQFPAAGRALTITVTVCLYPWHGCLIVMVIAGWYPEFSHEKIPSDEESRAPCSDYYL